MRKEILITTKTLGKRRLIISSSGDKTLCIETPNGSIESDIDTLGIEVHDALQECFNERIKNLRVEHHLWNIIRRLSWRTNF